MIVSATLLAAGTLVSLADGNQPTVTVLIAKGESPQTSPHSATVSVKINPELFKNSASATTTARLAAAE
ncbi:hypothetical protein [Roseibium aggregatum]|uniref:Uncharacterized protein n=1 Tax=Roseibium aggregatum TaxID=187304 RepID=A0A0M6YE64_9HYPH|nr:hypothetical protein [Roseibium aggregatum]CTQ47311.1 hypothetical protein LAL4801_05773 [Roseibium aggregatum]